MMSSLHYFHAAISNHLSVKAKNVSCFIWLLNTGLFTFGYFQEKEQVKSQAIRKGYDKLLVEYLGKDPEKWPSKDEVG